jgi:hypothetical protein
MLQQMSVGRRGGPGRDGEEARERYASRAAGGIEFTMLQKLLDIFLIWQENRFVSANRKSENECRFAVYDSRDHGDGKIEGAVMTGTKQQIIKPF